LNLSSEKLVPTLCAFLNATCRYNASCIFDIGGVAGGIATGIVCDKYFVVGLV
jgi:hypothetical protein